MAGVATLETPAEAVSGRSRPRDRGAVELVRFLAAPLRYLDVLREDPRGVGGGDLTAIPARVAALTWTLHLLERHPDDVLGAGLRMKPVRRS